MFWSNKDRSAWLSGFLRCKIFTFKHANWIKTFTTGYKQRSAFGKWKTVVKALKVCENVAFEASLTSLGLNPAEIFLPFVALTRVLTVLAERSRVSTTQSQVQ